LNRVVDLIRSGGSLAAMDFGNSRPDHGLLWWLFPLSSFALHHTGNDSPEDLDNVKLEAKYASRKDLLMEPLGHMDEEHLNAAGLIITARKPFE